MYTVQCTRIVYGTLLVPYTVQCTMSWLISWKINKRVTVGVIWFYHFSNRRFIGTPNTDPGPDNLDVKERNTGSVLQGSHALVPVQQEEPRTSLR